MLLREVWWDCPCTWEGSRQVKGLSLLQTSPRFIERLCCCSLSRGFSQGSRSIPYDSDSLKREYWLSRELQTQWTHTHSTDHTQGSSTFLSLTQAAMEPSSPFSLRYALSTLQTPPERYSLTDSLVLSYPLIYSSQFLLCKGKTLR